jgi:hypothetical protein
MTLDGVELAALVALLALLIRADWILGTIPGGR